MQYAELIPYNREEKCRPYQIEVIRLNQVQLVVEKSLREF